MYTLYWLYLCYCMGSFLTVIVARWQLFLANSPLSLTTLFTQSSHCTKCHTKIAWYDNIPIISYLLLKGKCRQCRASISLEYIFIELITLLSGLCIILLFENQLTQLELGGLLFFTWLLLALAIIDLKYGYLPDRLTYLLLWSGLLYACFTDLNSPSSAICGASLGYLLMWLVDQFYQHSMHKKGMGNGDFKLTAALGAWLGSYHVIIMIWIASILCFCVFFLYYLYQKKRPMSLPFGPYLAITGWVIIVIDLIKPNYFNFL